MKTPHSTIPILLLLTFLAVDIQSQDYQETNIKRARVEQGSISSSELTLQSDLDSLVGYAFQSLTDSSYTVKNTYKYDSYGTLTEIALWGWSYTDNAWAGDSRNVYSFDSRGNLTLDSEDTWNDVTKGWDSNMKTEYTFDSLSNMIQHLYSWWSGISNEWMESRKGEYSYDSAGNRISEIQSRWSIDLDDWGKQSKIEFKFDSTGNMTLKTSFQWDEDLDDWRATSQISYSNYNKDLLGTMIDYNWSTDLDTWIAARKTDYSYDHNLNLSMQLMSGWDANLSEWNETRKKEYTYDTKGNLIREAEYYKQPGSIDWRGTRKTEYGYNPNDHNISETVYFWSTDLNDWEARWKYEYHYDSWGNKIIRSYYPWDSDITDWDLTAKTYYYYSCKYHALETDSICNGDSLFWQDQYIKTEGIHYASYTSEEDLDSIYEMNLTILPSPDPFTITGQDDVDEFQVYTYSVPASSELNYIWLVENGNHISNLSNNAVEIQWGASGDGAVLSISENQYECTSDTSRLNISIVNTGVTSSMENGIAIFPNPTHSILNIGLANVNLYERIEVMDVSGKMVLEKKIINERIVLQLGYIPAGIYLLRIKGQTDLLTKFMKY